MHFDELLRLVAAALALTLRLILTPPRQVTSHPTVH